MGQGHRGEVQRQLHALLSAGTVAGLSDGQLLERFTAQHAENAEQAFTAIVERYGPTVLRVCRGVLSDAHDAEDAFQATFLVLANKARSIRRGDSIGSWLYGVALRVASEARSVAARRRTHERRAAKLRTECVGEPEDHDLGRTLYEEVGRLPEPLRAAIVLCDMEGCTREEAAHRLGWPVGTVKTRLGSARMRLRHRLVRRGLAPSVGIGASLTAEGVRAAVPSSIARITAQAGWRLADGQLLSEVAQATVETLVQGVIMSLFKRKLRATAVATLLSLGAVVACVGLLKAVGAEDPPAIVPNPPSARGESEPTTEEKIAPLLGTWELVSSNGLKFNRHIRMSIKAIRGGSEVAEDLGFGGHFACASRYESDQKPSTLLYVDPEQNPPHINFVPLASWPSDSGQSADGTPAIYRVEGDLLTIHKPARLGTPRPVDFKREANTTLEVYRRVPMEPSARDRAGKTLEDARQALKRPIKMPFSGDTPLGDVLDYVALVTRGPAMPNGVPIYVDIVSVRKSVWASKVKCPSEQLPLGDALTAVLKPLGLSHTIRNGQLLITGP